MPATEFHLVTEWMLDNSQEEVWRVLIEPERWPVVKRVGLIDPGDADGIGSVRRLSWSTALPYDITFETTTVTIEPMRLIEGHARGELDRAVDADAGGCPLPGSIRLDRGRDQALDGATGIFAPACLRLEPQSGDGARPARAGGLSRSASW